jgi:hypothetical protein
MIAHLQNFLHADWDQHPIFAARHGDYQFLIAQFPGTVPPPSDYPPLVGADAAMLAVLEDSLPAMNLAVSEASAAIRATPPPAPPSPDSRGFFRIKADWSFDSDTDGTPDWLEWILVNHGQDEYGLRYDPFNPDTNSDGVPDGDQLDADGDGAVNAKDANPADGAISIERSPRWRYAVFPIPSHGDDLNPVIRPNMINAQGKVLYFDSIWHNGLRIPLIRKNENHIDYCHAIAMNDSGAILGEGVSQRPPENPAPDWLGGSGGSGGGIVNIPAVAAWWDNHDVPPVPVEAQGHYARLPTLPEIPAHQPNAIAWDALLAPGGHFLGDRPQGGNGELIRSMWRRTAGGFAFAENIQLMQEGFNPLFVAGPLRLPEQQESHPEFVWGPVQNGTLLLDSGQERQLGISVLRVGFMPVAAEMSEYPVAYTLAGHPSSKQTGSWVPQASFEGEVDVSTVTAVRIAKGGNLEQDTRSGSFHEWAPGLPFNMHIPPFINSSENGWILLDAQSAGGFAVAMPVLFEDDEESTGVDSFSLSGTMKVGDSGTQEKSWVMVPRGGSPNGFQLKSLAGDGNVLTLHAPGLEFGNGTSQAEINQPETNLTLKVAEPEPPLNPSEPPSVIPSGTEFDFVIKLGDSTSLTVPLAAKVMAQRVAKVGVFRVHRLRENNTPDEPNLFPDEAELTAYLNSIYEPQINLRMELTFVPTPIISNPNHHLNMAVGGENFHSEEQAAIVAEADGMELPNFNMRVFIVPSPHLLGGAYGIANRAAATCWVWGTQGFRNVDAAFQNHTIAHEVGHILTDYGHPDDWHGTTRVLGSDFRKRLMASGNVRGVQGTLLVKSEWDQAERWMKVEIDKENE